MILVRMSAPAPQSYFESTVTSYCDWQIICMQSSPRLLQEGAEGKIAAGALLGAYEATRFKSKVKPVTTLEQVEVIVPPAADVAAGQKAADHAVAMAKGALLTRCVSGVARGGDGREPADAC